MVHPTRTRDCVVINTLMSLAPSLRFALGLCEAVQLVAKQSRTAASGSATVILSPACVDRAVREQAAKEYDGKILCEHGVL